MTRTTMIIPQYQQTVLVFSPSYLAEIMSEEQQPLPMRFTDFGRFNHSASQRFLIRTYTQTQLPCNVMRPLELLEIIPSESR
jgi:hypothetical protein